MLERGLRSHWRGRSANLSVDLNLISVRQALRTPMEVGTEDESSGKGSGSPFVYLSPAKPVTPLIEIGEVRPLSPNKLYLLRQGIVDV